MLDKKIEYFIAVVENGSFSSAANALYLSQSALSQQIKILERNLGIQLFDRSKYKAILTREGWIFYEGCKALKQQSEELMNKIRPGLIDDIRIGFSGLSDDQQSFEIIASLKREYPSIHVHLIQGSYYEILDSLHKGAVDFAFGLKSTFTEDEELDFHILRMYELYLACHSRHALASEKYVEKRTSAKKNLLFCLKTMEDRTIGNRFSNPLKTWDLNRRLQRQFYP